MACGIAIAGAAFVNRQAFHIARLTQEQFAPASIQINALVGGFQDALLVAVAVSVLANIISSLRSRRELPDSGSDY